MHYFFSRSVSHVNTNLVSAIYLLERPGMMRSFGSHEDCLIESEECVLEGDYEPSINDVRQLRFPG